MPDFQPRRVRWLGRPVDVILNDMCDDLDELEVNVSLEVQRVKKQQWAIMLLLISTLLTIIGALLAVKG